MLNIPQFYALWLAMLFSTALPLFAQPNTQNPVGTAPTLLPDSLKGWKLGGAVGLNFSQTALSNWAGGGQNSISIVGILNGFANFKQENFFWDNALELGLGAISVSGQTSPDFRKSDDKIIFVSKAGLNASSALSYALLLDFRTQFLDGFNFENRLPDGTFPVISRAFAPGYLVSSLGLDYHPADFFSAFFAPLSGRTILVLDERLSAAGAFGVERNQRARLDLGAALNVLFKKELIENVTYQSRLSIFAPYRELERMVVSWENLLVLKVNKYINVTWDVQVFYDERVAVLRNDGTTGPATQFKSVLGVGIVYTL